MSTLSQSEASNSFELTNWNSAVPVAAGAGLLLYGLVKGSFVGWSLAAIGGGLAYYGYQRALDRGGFTVRDTDRKSGWVKRALTLGVPTEELYNFWLKPENITRITPGVSEIEALADGKWLWHFQTSAGHELKLTSEIVGTKEPGMIHWRTVGGSPVDHQGEIKFKPAPADRGTEMELTLSWRPKDPFTQLASDFGFVGKAAAWHGSEMLRRAKQILETGELTTATYAE